MIYTDDVDDPCSYCVGWVDDPADDTGQEMVAVGPHGPVKRLYQGTHPGCDAMVEAYEAERRPREVVGE